MVPTLEHWGGWSHQTARRGGGPWVAASGTMQDGGGAGMAQSSPKQLKRNLLEGWVHMEVLSWRGVRLAFSHTPARTEEESILYPWGGGQKARTK